MDYIRALERQQIREDVPTLRVGDNVKVHYRIKEGDRERIQVFQGDIIRLSGAGSRETFTVRKISFGIGVERTFPVHSPKAWYTYLFLLKLIRQPAWMIRRSSGVRSVMYNLISETNLPLTT